MCAYPLCSFDSTGHRNPFRILPLIGVAILAVACKANDLKTAIPMEEANSVPLYLAPTNPVPPCDETLGHYEDQTFSSSVAHSDVLYHIYLPPCYSSSGRRYPYLVLLHGRGENDTQWEDLGIGQAVDLGYARGALPPMLVVMPSWMREDYGSDTSVFPDVIVKDLIPEVEQRFCTWGERFGRGIGGISRGGYWAYWIALTHPELFSRVGGHSPVFYESQNPEDENPWAIVASKQRIEGLEMYLDVGSDDVAVDPNLEDFVQHLHRRGIEPTYVVHPAGDHSNRYWGAHVADYLSFYAADWPRSISQFPACDKPAQ